MPSIFADYAIEGEKVGEVVEDYSFADVENWSDFFTTTRAKKNAELAVERKKTITKMLADGLKPREIAEKTGVSLVDLYNFCARYFIKISTKRKEKEIPPQAYRILELAKEGKSGYRQNEFSRSCFYGWVKFWKMKGE